MHTRRLWPLVVLGALMFAVFSALGVWQLQRLAWKRALIAQVEQHLAAEPVAAPAPEQARALGNADAYRRVQVRGEFAHRLETCTLAVTEYGSGCWVMTPLRTEAGWWLLVNRGFVPLKQKSAAARPQGQVQGMVTVTGLLRLSEPKGGFLRSNQASQERWYSRDVAAIAAARGLAAGEVAPYFIDAETQAAGGPKAGLTVVRFNNNHLAYALTWFGMALGVLVAARLVWRHQRRGLEAPSAAG